MKARYLTTGFLAVDPRAFGIEFLAIDGGSAAPEPFETCGDAAIVDVCGPLEQHPHWLWQDYDTIRDRCAKAFASSARKVVLRINSPGGAAAGCFELARALRAMAETARKPLVTYVDGQACSAAYAIACAANGGIHAPMTARVGSLSVYEMMVDQTALDAARGLKWLCVHATGDDLKLTGNPHLTATEAQVAHTREQVDLLRGYFVDLIVEMRGVSAEAVREIRGADLLAAQGLSRGLVDEVSDWSGFLAALATFEGTQMPTTAQAKSEKDDGEKKSPFEMALDGLHEAAKADDDDGKAAQKMLADHYKARQKASEGGDSGGEKKDEPSEEEKAKKAAAEEDEKKAKAVKASEDEEARKAQARAAAGPGLDMARELQELKAKDAARDAREAKALEDGRRAQLLAQRPDFSESQRKTLASCSLEIVEDAVKSWPKANFSPSGAAAAAVPGVTPGRADTMVPGVIQGEQAMLLARMDAAGARATQARMEGSRLVLERMTPKAAAARVQQMQEQGIAPHGDPGATVDPSAFKASQVRK